MALGLGTSVNVGLFGKVPMLPDFVRFNAGSPSARSWDEWMNSSLTELRRAGGPQWEARFDAFPALHFISRPTGDNRQVLAGHIRPSRDESGRRYPLTVFCELQLDRQGRGVQVLPFALEPFLESASTMANACASHTPEGSILRAMGALVPESVVESTQRAMTDRLRAVTMESFWCSLLERFDDPRKYLCIKNLFGILAPMRGHDPQRLSMALRFPGITTKSDVSPSFAAAIWMSLSRAVIGEESLSTAWLFWICSEISARNGTYLFFRSPSPTMLSFMLNSESGSDDIWDIESMDAVRISEARDSLGPAITSVLDTPRFPVLEFIQRI
jgi:type VI secretion system protein ImpM